MARRSKTGSTVSTVQLLAAVLVLIGVGIALALMFGPDKPEAPPVSHVSYAERPEARQPAAGRLPNEAPRLAQRLSHETGRGSAAIAETAAPPETAPYSATVRVGDLLRPGASTGLLRRGNPGYLFSTGGGGEHEMGSFDGMDRWAAEETNGIRVLSCQYWSPERACPHAPVAPFFAAKVRVC